MIGNQGDNRVGIAVFGVAARSAFAPRLAYREHFFDIIAVKENVGWQGQSRPEAHDGSPIHAVFGKEEIAQSAKELPAIEDYPPLPKARKVVGART